MPKRKQSVNPAAHKSAPPMCILHVSSLSDHGNFTLLTKIKGNAARAHHFLKIKGSEPSFFTTPYDKFIHECMVH